VSGFSRWKLVLLFLIKIIACGIFWLVYTQYFTRADFMAYFEESSKLIQNVFNNAEREYAQAWTGSEFENSWFNGAKVMIIINSILHLFSFGNYYVNALLFVFFSYIGLVALLKSFQIHFPHKRLIVVALFFIPGVLFWGSAPLKEAIMLGTVGLILGCSDFGLRKMYSKKSIFLIVSMAVLLLLVKFYVLILLIPLLLVNFVVSRTSKDMLFIKYIGVFAILSIIMIIAASISPDLNVLTAVSDKQAKAISEAKGGIFLSSKEHFICVDFYKEFDFLELQKDGSYKVKPGSTYLQWELENMSDTTFITNSTDTSTFTWTYMVEPAKSVIHIPKLKPKIGEYISYAPKAFITSLMRPGFWEIRSWVQMLSAIENIWMIVLLIVSIMFFDRKVIEHKEVLLFCILFTIIIFVLVGITTPVLGALVRYKMIGNLFLACFCFIILDEEKLLRKLKIRN
jgi:hypothetical protein